jgi:nitrate reductase gamma subunit
MSDKPPVLAGTAAERIAVAVASPFLALLCYGCYIATHARFGSPSAADWKSRLLDRVFLAMFSEMFVAFLAFLAIAFIWALFQPAWTTRVLGFVRHHAWHAMLLFLAGFGVSLIIVYAVA